MIPGENAAPIHPNCRCSVSAYEDSEDYEAWIDYLDKGGSTAEWNDHGKAEWEKNKHTKQTDRKETGDRHYEAIKKQQSGKSKVTNTVKSLITENEPSVSRKNVKDIEKSTKSSTIELHLDDSKQLGRKIGKHARDFGLDETKAEDREKVLEIIENIYKNAEEIRIGAWRGQSEDVLFYIKGNDVVVTKQNGDFITILQGGIDNERIKNARIQ